MRSRSGAAAINGPTVNSTGIRQRGASRRKLGFLLLGVLVGLGGMEGALRWLVPASTQFFVNPPRLTRWFQPLPDIMPGIKGPAHVTTNSLGLRGRELDTTAPQEFRILAIGGSTTECLYLDDAATWPALVEQILTRRRGEIGRAHV